MRTLRFYRERGLLPPPRREGRIGWYDDHHLARLRTVAGLLERGHTLSAIADLTAAFESGRDVGELLGLDRPAEEDPARLAPAELAGHFEGEVTPENLATALGLDSIRTDGDTRVHVGRRLLDASASLVREGIAPAAVLESVTRVRRHAEALADIFTATVRDHVADADAERLCALAERVVEAEFSMALARRLPAADRGDD
ncbi:MerR family transcriptional regulator [Streptomyces stramineus]|uniref:MerR family transcriptional regulator n=1 Tax=Streptomyces stramineus TaxID=173861 RepID=A0ABP3J7H9_9ACTN